MGTLKKSNINTKPLSLWEVCEKEYSMYNSQPHKNHYLRKMLCLLEKEIENRKTEPSDSAKSNFVTCFKYVLLSNNSRIQHRTLNLLVRYIAASNAYYRGGNQCVTLLLKKHDNDSLTAYLLPRLATALKAKEYIRNELTRLQFRK